MSYVYVYITYAILHMSYVFRIILHFSRKQGLWTDESPQVVARARFVGEESNYSVVDGNITETNLKSWSRES